MSIEHTHMHSPLEVSVSGLPLALLSCLCPCLLHLLSSSWHHLVLRTARLLRGASAARLATVAMLLALLNGRRVLGTVVLLKALTVRVPLPVALPVALALPVDGNRGPRPSWAACLPGSRSGTSRRC